MSTNPLNNSSCKQKYSFSKSSRFSDIKLPIDKVSYTYPT